jgi:hypothetical protein
MEHRIKWIGRINKYIKDTIYVFNIHEICLRNVGIIYPKSIPQEMVVTSVTINKLVKKQCTASFGTVGGT